MSPSLFRELNSTLFLLIRYSAIWDKKRLKLIDVRPGINIIETHTFGYGCKIISISTKT